MQRYSIAGRGAAREMARLLAGWLWVAEVRGGQRCADASRAGQCGGVEPSPVQSRSKTTLSPIVSLGETPVSRTATRVLTASNFVARDRE